MVPDGLRDFMEEKVLLYNRPSFIETDPISIPHRFVLKEDREISGFLTALLSWGQRPVILRNCQSMVERMDLEPFDFILNHTPKERKRFSDFIHRTFNGEDAMYLLKALQIIYRNEGGLEGIFSKQYRITGSIAATISGVRSGLLGHGAPKRTHKHIADPLKNSSAKRINMFLRWMVRRDQGGVDFGLWPEIPSSALFCPLDLHSGRVARMLGLLRVKQDNWKAVDELTENLRMLNPDDPVRYDFALYGLGINERFGNQ